MSERKTRPSMSAADMKGLYHGPDAEVPEVHQDDNPRVREALKQPSFMRQHIKGIIAANVLALSAGAGVVAYGVHTATAPYKELLKNPNPKDTASGPAEPGTSGETKPDTQAGFDANAPYIERVDTGALAQEYFSREISPIINARTDEGKITSKDYSELNSLTGGEEVPGLNEFVWNAAGVLADARKVYTENGMDDNVWLTVVPTEVTEEPAGPNELQTLVTVEYWATNEKGKLIGGELSSSSDQYRFTYASDTELIGGEEKEVEIVVDVEKLVDRP